MIDSTQSPRVVRLSRGEFLACFLAAMAVFFLCQGPLWKHRWQMDASILYSYLAVPLLVAGVLGYRKKWSLGAFALGTLEVMVWKFGATYVIAHTIWMFSPPPTRPPPSVEVVVPDRDPPLVPTPIAKDATGAIEGIVASGDASEVAGVALISSGLDAYTFAPSPAGASLLVGEAIDPSTVVAELHQEVRARSSDGRLHTVIASIDDEDLFNMPLQSSGAWSSANVRRGQGVGRLRCAVHQHSHETGALVVVRHPFHTQLEGDGHFRWEGVPAGHVTVQALGPGDREARAELDVVAGRTTSVRLVLDQPAKSP